MFVFALFLLKKKKTTKKKKKKKKKKHIEHLLTPRTPTSDNISFLP